MRACRCSLRSLGAKPLGPSDYAHQRSKSSQDWLPTDGLRVGGITNEWKLLERALLDGNEGLPCLQLFTHLT